MWLQTTSKQIECERNCLEFSNKSENKMLERCFAITIAACLCFAYATAGQLGTGSSKHHTVFLVWTLPRGEKLWPMFCWYMLPNQFWVASKSMQRMVPTVASAHVQPITRHSWHTTHTLGLKLTKSTTPLKLEWHSPTERIKFIEHAPSPGVLKEQYCL